jgi:hypothetical protein
VAKEYTADIEWTCIHSRGVFVQKNSEIKASVTCFRAAQPANDCKTIAGTPAVSLCLSLAGCDAYFSIERLRKVCVS